MSAALVALVGNPNAGKSALFNALTGARQRVGNYPGVTVERKYGRLALDDGRVADIVDLPGTYSLTPSSLDESVTRNVVLGTQAGERAPDLLVIVVDASNLDNHLRFALELIALGRPIVVALNMIDLAARDGLELDPEALSQALGVPVVPVVAVRRRGLDELRALVGSGLVSARQSDQATTFAALDESGLRREAGRIARIAIRQETASRRLTDAVDRVLLHPVLGFVILLALLFVMFQAVFAWAAVPADFLEGAVMALGERVTAVLPPGILHDFLLQAVIGGVGAVIVFLPQILILFLFILMLESSGYMTRAAFLMDGLMARVGLSGRAFIPLLSSFACAVPGIMATRTIPDARDRLTTILIAPLMTCSARLPVYGLIIAAFIPARTVGWGVGLQGLVLFILYVAGIVGAMLAAWALRRSLTKGRSSGFLMEMPKYQWPRASDILLGLWQRAIIFLKRAGTIILFTNVLLWCLASFPKAPDGVRQSEYSIAGRIASAIHVIVAPIGFNHDISMALLPSMAAREVAVSSIATVYAIDAGDDEDALNQELGERLQGRWSLATALAFLAWFVFAPQCVSTIAITRRETNGWRWPLFMLGYLFLLAYVAAGVTYWTARALGL